MIYWKALKCIGQQNSDKTQSKHNPEKVNNAEHNKTKLPGSVTFYDTQPGNAVGFFYNTPEAPTRGI